MRRGTEIPSVPRLPFRALIFVRIEHGSHGFCLISVPRSPILLELEARAFPVH